MSNDYQSGADPSAQMSHAELIAEQLTNIERLGDELPAVIAAGSLRKLLRHLDEAHKRELDAKDSVIQTLSSELQQLQEKREITIAAQKAKAAAEGYADGKRDAQVGNAAKLREALEKVRDSFYVNDYGDYQVECGDKVSDLVDAALAAPARNCDIYATVEEARKVWCGTPSRDWDYLCDWLYATTKEMEVSDGSK